METGNNFFPKSWVFFSQFESTPKESIVIAIAKLEGINLLICSKNDGKPLGSVLNLSFEDFEMWYSSYESKFSNCFLFGEECFAAWYPESWVGNKEEWIKPIDPDGTNWKSLVIDGGMELHFRFPEAFPKNLHFKPLMAHNAQRWLKNGNDSIRIHKNGKRMEMAVIKNKSIQLHTIFSVQSSNDAAYNCMLLYDQCSLPTEHISIIWEGEMDELAWEKLRPFIKKIDTSSSHPWSALSVLNNSHYS